MTPTHVKKLESGYWHVRFGPERFVQWRIGSVPELRDAFGEPKEEMITQALKVVDDNEFYLPPLRIL